MNNPSSPPEFQFSEPPEQIPENAPVFNIPTIILLIAGVVIAIHVYLVVLTGQETQFSAFFQFGFIPAGELPPGVPFEAWPRGLTAFTHAFLHGDWMHVGFNVLWLVAFGSAVAKRFGFLTFLVFFLLGSGAGAIAHAISHPAGLVPVVGASGAVSACMGAATRFAFQPARFGEDRSLAPALSLAQSLTNRSTLTFVLVWFVINWFFGSGVISIPGVEGSIAWEAHMGGFLFGWICFGLFDRVSGSASRAGTSL